MFRTKSEVDKHVGRILMRAKTSSERNKESLKIASLYFDVKDYAQAEFYLVNYLGEFSQDASAWELRGKLDEALDASVSTTSENSTTTSQEKKRISGGGKSNLLNEAIESYSRAYSLGNNHNLLLNICGCLLKKKEHELDINQAKEWLSSAEKHFNFHSTVVKLKEKLHTMLDSSSSFSSSSVIKSEEQVKDWESFLIKAINENILSEDLHLKLIKMYLRTQSEAAVRHFLLVENKSLFVNSSSYYSSLQSLFENSVIETEIKRMNFDYEETESGNYNYKLLSLINLMLLERVMLLLFQQADDDHNTKTCQQLFVKYNKYLSEYEKIKANVTSNYEPRSSFFFLTGNLLLKLEKYQLASGGGSNKVDFLQQEVNDEFEAVFIGHSSNVTTSGDSTSGGGPNWLTNTKLVSLFCFLQSIMTSDLKNSKTTSETTSGGVDNDSLVKSLLVKVVRREACWRYSIVGRWLKFIIRTYFGNDQIEFFKRVRNFTLNTDVRSTINELIALTGSSATSDQRLCYFQSLSDTWFKIEDTRSNFIDNSILEMADKNCLESQTSNLKYLIWHSLVNTKFDDSSSNNKSSDLNDSTPPIFYFKNIRPKMSVKYGVENLAICSNLDSLCLLDLKVFLYSCVFQSVSYLRNQRAALLLNSEQFFVEPFWLQSNLCESVQSEWWYYATNHLFKLSPSRKSLPPAISSSYIPQQLEDVNEMAVNLSPDAAKLTQLTRIVELIRLKSSQVSIGSEWRYKLNLRILINVANYLQLLYDESETNGSMDNAESTLGSPRQKQTYLKHYLIRYWQYLIKHLVKLKQIVNLDETTNPLTDDLDQIINMDQLNIEFIDLSLMCDTTSQSTTTSLYADLFKFYSDSASSLLSFECYQQGESSRRQTRADPRRLSMLVTQQKSDKANHNDSVIKNGILNLVLLNMKSLYESGFNATAAACVDDFDQANKIKKLKESLEMFDLIEKSINEKTRYQLSSSQMKICKEIGELLIDQRDQVEAARQRQQQHGQEESIISSGLESILENISVLIGCLKKMLKACFGDKRDELSERDQRLIDNLSTPKKQQTSVVEQQQNEPIAITAVVVASETHKESVVVESLAEEEEEQVQLVAPENQEESLNDECVVDELDKTLSAEQSVEEKHQQPSETMQDVNRSITISEEAKAAAEEESDEQNKKMLDLIEILTKQKIKHFELDVDTMRDQFGFIKSQLKQMNNEITHLSQRNQRRQKLQQEFADLVKDFHHECDVKSFNAQFNVFYWLFQQNPNLSEMFLKQSKEIESEMIRMNQQQAAGNTQRSQLPLPPAPVAVAAAVEPRTPIRSSENANTSSMFDYQTPPSESNKTNFHLLGQSIGELNFMSNSNQDIADQLKNSAMSFKQYQQEEDGDDDEEREEGELEDDGEEYGGYEDYVDDVGYNQGNASLYAMTSIINDITTDDTSRHNDTSFLSCEDYSSLSFANKSRDSS